MGILGRGCLMNIKVIAIEIFAFKKITRIFKEGFKVGASVCRGKVKKSRGDGFCFLRAGIPHAVGCVIFGHVIICVSRLV
jgi:hypothetical protein